jgi:hypothetical protein
MNFEEAVRAIEALRESIRSFVALIDRLET